MKRLALAITFLISGIAAALAQANVQVIGPITPGDCTMFSSPTIVKDGGLPCPGSGGTFNLPNGTTATTQSPFSDNTTKVATDAFVQGAISLNSTHFAAGGVTTGSANAQVISTVSPPVFSLTGNPTVTFIAGFSNSGATTLNVASSGVINILKKTPAGLVALVTGDIISGQQYLVTYDGTQYELQTPSQVVTAQIGANQITNALINPGAANTVKGTLNGTSMADLGVPSCSAVGQSLQYTSGTGFACVSSASSAPVVASRAFAITQNLSSFSAITTLGYAASGDGGGATFQKITGSFRDSFVLTTTVTNVGSGCTNGTYNGVFPTGGNGHGLSGIVVISGGVMSGSFTITGTGGNAYQVGDVLTISNTAGDSNNVPCSTTQPTITVASISTPLGSFTDSIGTKFQIVADQGNYINARQFGAVFNWTHTGGDAGATNDKTSIQSAMNFANFGSFQIDGGGFQGATVILPSGTALVCGGLVIPQAVVLKGQGMGATTLKECDAEAATQNFITLGDPLVHLSTFYESVQEMTLYGANATTTGTVAMVYSNSQQQNYGVYNVAIYPIYRGCVFTETGWGGDAYFAIHNMYCVANSSVTPFGVALNYPNAIHLIDGGTQFTSGSPTWGAPAVIVAAGATNVIRETYCEEVITCIQVNIPSGHATTAYIENVSGSGSVTNLITRVSGSQSGQLKVSNVSPNGATCTVNNNGSCASATLVLTDTLF
jgi:hypothetical protein